MTLTEKLELPIFAGSDKPSWLGDWNGSMTKLETKLGSVPTGLQTALEGVEANARVLTSVDSRVSALEQSAGLYKLQLINSYEATSADTFGSAMQSLAPNNIASTCHFFEYVVSGVRSIFPIFSGRAYASNVSTTGVRIIMFDLNTHQWYSYLLPTGGFVDETNTSASSFSFALYRLAT